MRTEPLSAKGAGVAKALATKNPVSERMRSIRRVLWVILVLNLAVAAAKYVYGLMSGSASMQADGIHSVFDSAGNVVGLVGIALAARPADDSHPYGHAKFETYASLVIGVLLLLAAFEVGSSAVGKLVSGVYTAESLSSSPRSASLTLAAAVQVPTLGVGSVLIRSPSLYCAVAIVLFALRESAVLTYRPS